MRLFLVVMVLGVLLVPEKSWAKTYTSFIDIECSHYSIVFGKTEVTEEKPGFPSFRGEAMIWVWAYMAGYLTYAAKHPLPESHHVNGPVYAKSIISWVGSWCRDFPSKPLSAALDAYIEK